MQNSTIPSEIDPKSISYEKAVTAQDAGFVRTLSVSSEHKKVNIRRFETIRTLRVETESEAAVELKLVRGLMFGFAI